MEVVSYVEKNYSNCHLLLIRWNIRFFIFTAFISIYLIYPNPWINNPYVSVLLGAIVILRYCIFLTGLLLILSNGWKNVY